MGAARHAAAPSPFTCTALARSAAQVSLRGLAAQLPKLGVIFDGWRSGRRLAGHRIAPTGHAPLCTAEWVAHQVQWVQVWPGG